MDNDKKRLKYIDQSVDVYAQLPRIKKSDGTRELVDDPDLWFASKINATLKTGSASDVYWEKKSLPKEKQISFVTGVRNHSWNRQHMGAMVVSGLDIEVVSSSLVSSAFTQGKFYKMQQQTRRSVVLDSIISNPILSENDEVKSSFQERFDLYWDIVEKRPEKYKGFDPYIQDAFKILPLATKTRFVGNLDLRTAKGYTRWRNLSYLPNSLIDFANKLNHGIKNEYPIMSQSYILTEQNQSSEIYDLQLKMVNSIGSTDLVDEPLLWYSDHSFLLPKNKHFEEIYNNFKLNEHFNKSGPNAIFIGYFNPLGISLDELLELFKNKDEETKAATELTSFTFASKIDISGGIDTWRHTRVNRIVQPIYHALENDPKVAQPILHQRQEVKGSEVPEKFMDIARDSVKLYQNLVKDGIPAKEAIDVLPHNLELIQIEMMDLFSFLNIMAIRTCIHARPEVQIWAKSLLKEVGKTGDFKGIDQLSEEKSNLLARGIVLGYCAELGNCKKCGNDVIYLPDPIRN